MDIAALKAELITGHPDTGPYDADATIAAIQLNAVNRTRNRTSMTGDEILNQVNAGDWNALTADKKQTVWDVCHLGTVNPFGVASTLLIEVFGAESTTIEALADARKEDASRVVELGLGEVHPGHIEAARLI